MQEPERRLAGIVAADVVGYSRLLGQDEAATLARVRALRSEIIEPQAAAHAGRLFKTTGDGFLLAFPSAVQALRCALAIQAAQRAEGALQLRIGVHQGEVIPDGDDLHGDGVVIAARLEPLAEPGGIALSARVREDAMGKVAIETEDLGTPTLKNIAQPIQVFRIRPAAPERQALALPDKPSLAVLPFQNMSGDPEQEYFADGMVEEIITALSRFRQLFVIARNSSFTYKGRAVDVKQVGRDLGVRYVLEGSVRKAANRVRITGQLIDAATGAHLWADRFDGPLEDIFELQDRIAESVVASIAPTVEKAELLRARRKPTGSLDAYDCYLRGIAGAAWLVSREGNEEASHFFYRAIALDPEFASAYAMATHCLTIRRVSGWRTDAAVETAEALRLARLAVELGHDDADVLARAGMCLAHMSRDLDAGLALTERALALNPNSAWAANYAGWLK
ncbi:MAG: adenylate/guanylate cyclase domain-containing protein, partial [Alphaproteobacteria bacterium]|nr:adenylate/guanylate cyclase domain-containing protein [Alphaproteobacteria bacterium]